MDYLLYLIALFALLRLFLYLLAYLRILKATFLYLKFHSQTIDQVPEHFQIVFQPAIAALEQFGFQFCEYFGLEQMVGERDTGLLMCHTDSQTYVGIELRRPYTAANPFNIGFSSFFQDGTQVLTTTHPFYNLFSGNPKRRVRSLVNASLAELWQAHQEQLNQQHLTCKVSILSPATYIERLETHSREEVERLTHTGEVYPVEVGKSYRITRWAAWSVLRKILQGQAQLKRLKPSSDFPTVSSPVTRPLAGSTAAGAVATDFVATDFAAPDSAIAGAQGAVDPDVELDVEYFQWVKRMREQRLFSRNAKIWILLGSVGLFAASYLRLMDGVTVLIFVGVILLHESGHLLAMKAFGYQDTAVFFVPFLGALATSRNHNATLTQKFWMLLAGPLPGLVLGIGLAIATHPSFALGKLPANHLEWIQKATWILISLNLFNLLPIYPLDGGQIANLLLFSRHPFLAVIFQSVGALFLLAIGLTQPPFLIFALLVAYTIPHSFRLAQLRKKLLKTPSTEPETMLRTIFQLLKQQGYGKRPFNRRYILAKSLLESHPEGRAKRRTRIGLSGIYGLSLVGSLVGILFSFMPNVSAWTKAMDYYMKDPREVRQQTLQKDLDRVNQALAANPTDVAIYLKRGRIYQNLNNQQAAIADFNRAVQIDPKNLEVYRARAQFRTQVKDYPGAIADYDQMVRLDPQNTKTYLRRAWLYRLMHNPQKANQDYAQILKLDPQNKSAYYVRGAFRQEMRDFPGALADYTKLLQITPDDEETYLARAEVLQEMKDFKGAISDLDRAIQLDLKYTEAYELRGKIRLQLGDRDGAESDQQLAAKFSTENEQPD